jgi:hypothetical protein
MQEGRRDHYGDDPEDDPVGGSGIDTPVAIHNLLQ